MIERLLNWKKHPASVFFFAVPLAVIGFALFFARAFLELSINGDPWYLVITLCAVLVLCAALWPVRHGLGWPKS
jgi:hypothetical protein